MFDWNDSENLNRDVIIDFLRKHATVEWGGYRVNDGSYTHLLQVPEELADLICFLREDGLAGGSLLEIGFAEGFTNTILHKIFKFELITAVDLEPSSVSPAFFASNCKYKPLNFFFGKSMDSRIIKSVNSLGPYDVVFIDASHEREDVLADFKNYFNIEKSRYAVFHDIRNPRWPGCGLAWESIKNSFPHLSYREFIGPPRAYSCGIGVLINNISSNL